MGEDFYPADVDGMIYTVVLVIQVRTFVNDAAMLTRKTIDF
jgi:hypothetical protein